MRDVSNADYTNALNVFNEYGKSKNPQDQEMLTQAAQVIQNYWNSYSDGFPVKRGSNNGIGCVPRSLDGLDGWNPLACAIMAEEIYASDLMKPFKQ